MNYLFVIDTPPYGQWSGREVLDMAFAVAAFDGEAALLFRDAGVHWLRPNQEPAAVGQKSVVRNLSAAALFGIRSIYAEAASLRRFGIENTPDSLDITETDSSASIYTHYDHVVQL